MKKAYSDLSGWDVAIALLLIPLAVLCKGWCASKLWNWFIVTWLGWPPLPVLAASGLVLLLAVVRPSYGSSESFEWSKVISRDFIIPPVLVFLGWIFFNLWT